MKENLTLDARKGLKQGRGEENWVRGRKWGKKIVWAQELTKIPCGLGFLFQQQQSICFQLWDVWRICSAEHNLVEYFSNGLDIISPLKSVFCSWPMLHTIS